MRDGLVVRRDVIHRRAGDAVTQDDVNRGPRHEARRRADAPPVCRTYDGVKKKGPRKIELSWILESNTAANAVLKKMGARRSKTYRIYEKPL